MNTKMLEAITVNCPRCKSRVGSACHRLDGRRRITTPHRDRVRDAKLLQQTKQDLSARYAAINALAPTKYAAQLVAADATADQLRDDLVRIVTRLRDECEQHDWCETYTEIVSDLNTDLSVVRIPMPAQTYSLIIEGLSINATIDGAIAHVEDLFEASDLVESYEEVRLW